MVRLARRCADQGLVDEVVQDTFVAVWRGAGRRTWLHGRGTGWAQQPVLVETTKLTWAPGALRVKGSGLCDTTVVTGRSQRLARATLPTVSPASRIVRAAA